MRVHVTRGRPGRRNERGGVAAVVGLLMIPVMLLSAFTLDYGIAYAQAQAYASGADSASLAILKAKRAKLTGNPAVVPTCATLMATDGGEALAIAKQQADANGPFGLKSASNQFDVQVALSCVDKNGNPSPTGMLRADVTVKRAVPTTFGKLAGVSTINAIRSSSAALGVAADPNGVFPLAICDKTADLIMTKAGISGAPYPTETIEVDKVWMPGCHAGGGNSGSGNWGWLDCGGGVSVPAIAAAIDNGCPTDFTLTGNPPSAMIDGAPGNKINSNNLKTSMDGALGGIYAFPVYSKITGNGANTAYTVVGFIELQLVSYDTDGNIQVKYVNYSPVGSINTSCGIGSPTCKSYNTWAIRLMG